MKTHLTETYLKAARIHLVILHCSLGKPLRICFPILRVYHSLIMIVRNVFISINKRMSKHSHILFSILHQSLHFTCIKLPSSSHGDEHGARGCWPDLSVPNMEPLDFPFRQKSYWLLKHVCPRPFTTLSKIALNLLYG